jgi:hypothetical protein
MPDNNGNKALRTFLWTIIWTLLLGSYAWATFINHALIQSVVANDRIREAEDKVICSNIAKTKDDFIEKMDVIKDQNSQILNKVVRLETLMSKR